MIPKQEVQHIAKLARIELSKKEEEKFQKELSSILDFVKKLDEINIVNVKKIGQITGLEGVVRDDNNVLKQDFSDKILKQAPSKKGRYIKVPKILGWKQLNISINH